MSWDSYPPNYFKLVDHPYQGAIGGPFLMYNDTKDLLIKILGVLNNKPYCLRGTGMGHHTPICIKYVPLNRKGF